MNVLHIVVENPDELLNASGFGAGALLRVESSSDNQSFVEFTTTAIVTATTLYTIYHSTGTTSTWYRSRYSNSGGSNFSEYSASFQPGGAPIEYTSLAAVKTALTITDTNDDDILASIAADANEWLEGKIGYPVGPVGSETRTFDGARTRKGGRYLSLYPFGIRTVTSVKTRDYTGGSQTTLGSTDYFVRPHASERPTGWPGFELWVSDTSGTVSLFPTSGFDVIEVTATWGWDRTPADLAGLATRLAVTRYRRRGVGSARTFGFSADGEQLYEDELTVLDKQLIERYRSLSSYTVQ